MKRLFGVLSALFALLMVSAANRCHAEILFESGTLGPTGVPIADLVSLTVPSTVVDAFIFPGVRFQLTRPVVTSQIGGHFVEETAGTFFGAIVKLDDQDDFPNSADLSTPDVLGVATLSFPHPSAEVFGNLNLSLDPGWYALVFGGRLFGTDGSGGAVRNGTDIGSPIYFGYGPNLHWFNFDVLALPFDIIASSSREPSYRSRARTCCSVSLTAAPSLRRTAGDSSGSAYCDRSASRVSALWRVCVVGL